MKRFCWLLACLGGIRCGFSQHVVTMGSMLKEMVDPVTVTRLPDPAYTLRQASSYDRRSVSPDQPGWFANADFNQFIREEKKEGHLEYVMMDADGPGAIVRFWLTTQVKQGTMRLYFDGADQPQIVIPGFDLMRAGWRLGPGLLNPHSSYEPEGKGGNTLYLPLPYQQHCKVTWEFADSASAKTSHYYQINYRTYSPGTQVGSYRASDLDQYRTEIDAAETALWHPIQPKGKTVKADRLIMPGAGLSMNLPGGPNAIHVLNAELYSISQNLATATAIWRNTWIRIAFDGVQTVDCPVGDFIGSGEGGKKIGSWWRELTDSGWMTSRWVMPYQQNAVVSIVNKGSAPVGVKLQAILSPFHWTPGSLYFHATYKFGKDVRDVKWDYDLHRIASKDKDGPVDWNFATLQGRGLYMGNTLAVDNHMDSWYGEGDAKAWVDGEAFPSEFGTGLEDYYNTSWAPVVLYQTPFANAPRADAPSSIGKNTFTRTRILDAIPFNRSFAFDMEMLSWNGGTIDIGATTYWYGSPTSKAVK